MLGNISSAGNILYFSTLTLVGLFCMWFDKQSAKSRDYRIPELFFFGIASLGAVFGVWIGMYLFHHKTRKLTFVLGIPFILIIQISLYIYFNL